MEIVFINVLVSFTKKEYHIYYRKLICEYINSKKVYEMDQHPYLPDIYNNKTLLYNDYLNKMVLTGEYAGEYEFINACLSIRCNIFIYKLDDHNIDYTTYKYNYETLKSTGEIYNLFLLYFNRLGKF